MKYYPKEYEDVYSREYFDNGRGGDQRLKFESEHFKAHCGMPIEEYKKLCKETFIEFDQVWFKQFVKVIWLRNQYTYKGKRALGQRMGMHYDVALVFFFRHYVGHDLKNYTRSMLVKRIETYLPELFPNFNDGFDPFKDEYEYPYKHVSLSFWTVVYLMEERLDLLNEAENKKMSYSEFLDYVINYIHCYNDDLGDEKYIFKYVQGNPPFIRIAEKYYEGTHKKT